MKDKDCKVCQYYNEGAIFNDGFNKGYKYGIKSHWRAILYGILQLFKGSYFRCAECGKIMVMRRTRMKDYKIPVYVCSQKCEETYLPF